MGLKDRLRRLEETSWDLCAETSSRNPLDTYFRALENLEKEGAGVPALPYTEEDRQDDEEFLLETLPFYRANLGWQTEEARRVLEEWERNTRKRLKRGEHY